ncbi:pentapeptide repeat-containing protein [Campylobacter coli]|uniref:pentapeptide repeat-containing protein n=1 Tax=Campylobacter coli TaxID=195 RepID=UPI00092F5801|nr:pentapeptide repeat-containing protein [Campylobacter coli]
MENFDKKLAQYGILAKNGKIVPKDNKITIIDAEIKEINFQALQEAGIKEICILESEIKYLYFLKKNTIKIDFRNCNFKNQIITRKAYFENEVKFQQCIFDAVVDFSKAEFNSKIDFLASVFKGEVRFIETQFQAEQSNNEIIENIFEEVVFEERASFDNAIFHARVSFRISQFKNEASFIRTRFRTRVNFENSQFKNEVRFIETQFQAEQSNNETIENNFGEIIFERRVSFSSATFQARVSFTSSHFKDEVNFAKTEFQANQNDSDIIENQFLGVIFAGKVIFDDAKFQARVGFGISQFKDEVRFIGTQFLAKQSSNRKIIENEFRETIFKGKVTFDSLALKARISFLFSTFKDEALFLNINPNNFIFHNVEFNKTKFACKTLTNVIFCLFQYSVFKDALSFEGMEFERLEFDNVLFNGVVTFSNTKLNTKPQFINCTFSNQFNIEHQYIKYSDKDIENKINNIQDKNDKFRVLLNLRDLFRKLKSNRIAHHNLIDASELRTQELYARELELKYKEKKSLRETIERWQLFFYRKLCDHHTDLLLNAKWLLYIVALYVLLLGKMIWVYPILIIIFLASIYLCKIKNIWLNLSSVTVLMAVVYCPKMIFGFTNLFTSNLNYWQNLITTVYVVVIGLVLFSLQKTARKNSIVPS